jgi:ABC-type proline/glycine betaine transport system ATPase subunit
VVLMNNAVIEQVGSPQEVYDHPASSFAYQFLGHVNRFGYFVLYPAFLFTLSSAADFRAANAPLFVIVLERVGHGCRGMRNGTYCRMHRPLHG